jgi:hypothetical protein
MKFYISTRGIKRVTISSSSSGTGKGSPPTATPTTTTTTSRRINSRTLLPVVLVLGIVLPFLFVRIAFLVLESTTACSSPLGNYFFIFVFWNFLNIEIRKTIKFVLVFLGLLGMLC